MKYLLALIMPFFIVSCAFEKEQSDSVSSIFQFTTASVKIDSVTNGTNTYTVPPACIDFTKGSGVISYTLKSDGHYGSTDVDSVIRNSYLRFDRARLYLNDTAIDIIPVPENLRYNAETSLDVELTIDMIGSLQDGTYSLEIEMVASEFNGNGINTASNNTFSNYFGEVIISSAGQGCQ